MSARPNHLPAVFVTGTDTEIGKTLVSSALLRAWAKQGWRTAGMKPIAAGATVSQGILHNDDVDALDAASTEHPPLAWRCPYLMATAAAPHVAAQLEGIVLEPQIILQRLTQMRSAAQRVVVEGVGGFRVPLGDDYDTAQLALDLALPVVMVVGLRLGCINQALLTFEAIQARGLQVIGWVANSTLQDMPFESENIQAIRQRLSVPLWGHIPRLTPQTLSEADRYLHIPQPWLE